MNDTSILILAAGESRRLGTPKQLVEYEGETLIRRVARAAVSSLASDVLIVVGHRAEPIEAELADLGVATISNSEFARGIGTSIRLGVANRAGQAGILISVCDQPFLTTDIFNHLIDRLPESQSGIVASNYAGTLGVPAVFAKRHFPKLLDLPDNAGAKLLIGSSAVDSIDFPLGVIDIDAPDDLAALR